MAFNSADTAAFKNVWVFCEQRQGVMMPTTFELISEGRKLANELGVELCGILLGDNVDGIAAELGEYGADKVYVYNSPLLKDFTTDAYTKVIVEAVEELKPEVLLMDEPTSALDPGSTMKVEELMSELKKNYTVVIVTHNMQQAARISDRTAFFLLGELVEVGPTNQIFSTPRDKRTEDYISGRFG